MANTIQCPNCKKVYPLDPKLAGKRVKCPCGQAITIPAMEAVDELELAPLEPASDPLGGVDPLAGGGPPANDPLAADPLAGPPPAAAAPVTLQSRAKPQPAADSGKSKGKKKKKSKEQKRKQQAVILSIVLGLFAVGIVTLAVVMVTTMNKPGGKTPEEAYEEYQTALYEKKWTDQFEWVTPESQEAMLRQLVDRGESMVADAPNTSGEVAALFRKYGRSEGDSNWWTGVKDKPQFYKDLIAAIEASTENTWPINGAVRTMMRKGIGDARRKKASAQLVDLKVEGDTATANRLTKEDDMEWKDPVEFKKVKSRWFVSCDEVPQYYAASIAPGGMF